MFCLASCYVLNVLITGLAVTATVRHIKWTLYRRQLSTCYSLSMVTWT